MITGHFDPFPHSVQVTEESCPPEGSIVFGMLEVEWNENMSSLFYSVTKMS